MASVVSNLSEIIQPSALEIYLRPLVDFINRNELTEVTVNEPGTVWTECVEGWKKYDVPLLSFEHCMSLSRFVTSHNGKTIGKTKPILSGTLPSGERIQIVTPPCTENGKISITIRKPSDKVFTLDDLENQGRFELAKKSDRKIKPHETEIQNLLGDGKIRLALDFAMRSKLNILIAGATGSGKTTVASSLALSIPGSERVITAEDCREIKLNHPNRVHLLYDRNGDGVSCKEVVEATLRMKPDRLIVSEVRGDEALSFLFSLNTGHAGLSTIHANGAEDALYQLAALVQGSEIGSRMPIDYILKRVFLSIDLVLYYQNYNLCEYFYEPDRKFQHVS